VHVVARVRITAHTDVHARKELDAPADVAEEPLPRSMSDFLAAAYEIIVESVKGLRGKRHENICVITDNREQTHCEPNEQRSSEGERPNVNGEREKKKRDKDAVTEKRNETTHTPLQHTHTQRAIGGDKDAPLIAYEQMRACRGVRVRHVSRASSRRLPAALS
jgi:hypothetical protein